MHPTNRSIVLVKTVYQGPHAIVPQLKSTQKAISVWAQTDKNRSTPRWILRIFINFRNAIDRTLR